MDPPIESHKRVSIPILDRLDRLQKRIPRRQRQRRATAAAAMETVKDFHHLRLHHPPANVSTICPLVASVSASSPCVHSQFLLFLHHHVIKRVHHHLRSLVPSLFATNNTKYHPSTFDHISSFSPLLSPPLLVCRLFSLWNANANFSLSFESEVSHL